MTDWEFDSGYPDYARLVHILTDFVSSKPENLKFKKLRLEMSCWDMKEKEANKFLTKTLTTDDLIEKFKKEQKPMISSKGHEDGEDEDEVINTLPFPNLLPD